MSTRQSDFILRWPTFDSEFEVQAELYHCLKNSGLNVRGEVLCRVREIGKHPKVRLDLVVFDDAYVPRLIIEVKNDNDGKSKLSEGRQLRRYSLLGLPILKCSGIGYISETKQRVFEILDQKASL